MRKRKYSGVRGFTLLELLAVMAIMLILSSLAVTGYRAMISGSGVGAAVGHLRQTLDLARQTAIMQGKSSYVVFYQDTGTAWYVTCMGEGYKTDGGGGILVDAYSAGASMSLGMDVFNLSSDEARWGQIIDVQDANGDGIKEYTLSASGIGIDDRYGWMVSQKVYLPRGFWFQDSSPDTVRFKPDGTACSPGGLPKNFDVYIYEETRPDQVYSVSVMSDGRITVKM